MDGSSSHQAPSDNGDPGFSLPQAHVHGSSTASPTSLTGSSARSPGPSTQPAQKPRSCAMCRSRKVRCDKLSPCTNCRRANIPCVVPSPDRIPRWARRLDRATLHAAQGQRNNNTRPGEVSGDLSARTPPQPTPQVVERLRNLEDLVKQLNAQLQQANASTARLSSSHKSDSPTNEAATTSQRRPGRLASRDAHSSRYVSSSFWSRIKDEIDALEMDTGEGAMDMSDSSEEGDGGQLSSNLHSSYSMGTHELDRAPAERHAFMFGHNLRPTLPQVDDFRPLPSQIPFLVNVFHDNVNMFLQAVHIPTLRSITQGSRLYESGALDPSTDTLLFSIYYCAVTSMDDDDVLTNFGTTKNDLNLRFRLGFEHALARADFLNSPNLTLVQALTLFLFLARRYDSPRYVWMLTGMTIRMAQALGLHRDGTNFPHLTPFEIEMRRRVWWALYMLDLRSSEDQGTDITIAHGSFDTKKPLNINDDEIHPNTKVMPREHSEFTNMTIPGIYIDTSEVAIKLLYIEIKDGIPDIEHHGRLATESYTRVYRYGAQLGNTRYRMGLIIASLIIAKITLILYLPVVSSISDGERSKEVSDKLYVSAVELAEYNHELNADPTLKQWRWLFQTYTHWYAIVYILIEVSRRPWSPVSERAWIALQSPWLIPKYPQHADKNNQVLVPLRQLMLRARLHRKTEVERLRKDPAATKTTEENDNNLPEFKSHGIDIIGSSPKGHYADRWHRLIKDPILVGLSEPVASQKNTNTGAGSMGYHFGIPIVYSPNSASGHWMDKPGSTDQASVNGRGQGSLFTDNQNHSLNTVSSRNTGFEAGVAAPSNVDNGLYLPAVGWMDGTAMTAGLGSWLWAEDNISGPLACGGGHDPGHNINVEPQHEAQGAMSWYDLIESAKAMDWEIGPGVI